MSFVLDKDGNYLPVFGEASGGGSGDVGNGKITINQGGTKKGDFTVNQAGDTVINLDAGGGSITIDDELSNSSENPVQNKIITAALGNKQDTSTAVIHTASTAVGSATKGAYIAANGTATAMTYSLEKDVPSNAVFTDTTYSPFVGADGTSAGASGLVPAPAATDNTKFLRGDGTFATVADTNLSNISTTGKGVITNLAVPSTKYDTVTAQASESWYTAPADGYYFLNISASGSGYARVDWEDGLWQAKNMPSTDLNVSWIIPIAQGIKIKVTYTASSITMFRFYYCYNNNA